MPAQWPPTSSCNTRAWRRPILEFNLGDAYFRKGAVGPAIWAFERALALDPGDEDARYNAEQARKLATARAHDKIEGEDWEPV